MSSAVKKPKHQDELVKTVIDLSLTMRRSCSCNPVSDRPAFLVCSFSRCAVSRAPPSMKLTMHLAPKDALFEATSPALVSTLCGQGTRGFADGTAFQAMFASPTGVAVNSAGDLFIADTNNHRIRRVSPKGEVSTFAGAGSGKFLDGPAAKACFREPSSVAIDSKGNVLVADNANHRVRIIDAAGQTVRTLAGSSRGDFADGKGEDASFYFPSAIAIDRNTDTIYVADSWNCRIRRITPDGALRCVFATTELSMRGSLNRRRDNSRWIWQAVACRWCRNLSLVRWSHRHRNRAALRLLVRRRRQSHPQNHASRRVVLFPFRSEQALRSAGVVSTIAGVMERGFADGDGKKAAFNFPHALTADAEDNLYVSDTSNQRIRKITPQGAWSQLLRVRCDPYACNRFRDDCCRRAWPSGWQRTVCELRDAERTLRVQRRQLADRGQGQLPHSQSHVWWQRASFDEPNRRRRRRCSCRQSS